MPTMKFTKERNNLQNDYIEEVISDDSDGEWKPGSWSKKNRSSLERKSLNQRLSFQESGGESDGGKTNNGCPVCRKSFSRSAALICHIKQNHSYMLKKHVGENSLQCMRRDIIEWKIRMNKKKKHSVSHRNLLNTAGVKTENEKFSDNEISSDNSLKESDPERDCADQFAIIGGSASVNGVDGSVQPSLLTSILSFDSASSELLDPDQSFSIVRQGSKKDAKDNKKLHKSTEPSSVNGNSVKHVTERSSVNRNSVKHVRLRETKPSRKDTEFLSVDLSNEDIAEDVKFYECFVCNAFFSSSSLLTYHHMRQHMTNEFQQCQDCGRVFYKPSLFTAHIKSHSK